MSVWKGKKEKEIIQSIIGHPVTNEKEVEQIVRYHLLEFEQGLLSFTMIRSPSSIELFGEGALEPTHIISDTALFYIEKGAKYHIFVCEECLKEARKRLESERDRWAKRVLADPVNLPSIPGMPHPSTLGKSIVIKVPGGEDIIKRMVFCTKPYTDHNIVEILTKGDINYEECKEAVEP